MPEDPASPNLTLPTPEIDILIPEPAWLQDFPDLETQIELVLGEALAETNIYKHVPASGWKSLEISFCFAGNDFVQELNREFRDQDRPTNVLSFSSDFEGSGDGAVHLGDVVLAYQVVRDEAKSQKKSIPEHTLHLVLHGLLHLLGFDHDTPEKALEMETFEKSLLKMFGINDPYA